MALPVLSTGELCFTLALLRYTHILPCGFWACKVFQLCFRVRAKYATALSCLQSSTLGFKETTAEYAAYQMFW